jgi:hypothetical protein
VVIVDLVVKELFHPQVGGKKVSSEKEVILEEDIFEQEEDHDNDQDKAENLVQTFCVHAEPGGFQRCPSPPCTVLKILSRDGDSDRSKAVRGVENAAATPSTLFGSD